MRLRRDNAMLHDCMSRKLCASCTPVLLATRVVLENVGSGALCGHDVLTPGREAGYTRNALHAVVLPIGSKVPAEVRCLLISVFS